MEAVSRVADGRADEAVVMCWTGTGASLAANKVAGIRAALCHDAETAKGARVWNHANVLALSLRATPIPVAREILDAWFSTPVSDDEWNLRQMARIRQIEAGAAPVTLTPRRLCRRTIRRVRAQSGGCVVEQSAGLFGRNPAG